MIIESARGMNNNSISRLVSGVGYNDYLMRKGTMVTGDPPLRCARVIDRFVIGAELVAAKELVRYLFTRGVR